MKKIETKKAFLWILDILINIAIIFGLVLVIQKWLIAPFDVSGASMCDTLNFIDGECTNSYGEKIIINEATYFSSDPERGDIVVFKTEENEGKYFIKRVIGLPGEIVEIEDGKLYITKAGAEEREKLEEPYLNSDNKDNTKIYFSHFSKFEVPEEKYFMLGDNRKASTDSRTCFQGSINGDCKNNPSLAFVERDLIRGKAWFIWWPLSTIRTLDTPEYNIDQPSESLEEK